MTLFVIHPQRQALISGGSRATEKYRNKVSKAQIRRRKSKDNFLLYF